MLNDLFPRSHERYLTLPVLGSIADGYCRWLFKHGYRRRVVRLYMFTLVRLDRQLQEQGRGQFAALTRDALQRCRPGYSQTDRNLAAILTTLEGYLDEQQLLPPPAPQPMSQCQRQLSAYRVFLAEVCGFAQSTLHQHLRTATLFLQHVRYEHEPTALDHLSTDTLEGFVKAMAGTQCRASLQHSVAQLRSFLRFLAARQLIRPGFDTQLDTPRHYRLEQLPRALAWDCVQAFLESIDRRTAMGLRDYTLFFLMSHYGLRACDLVTLRLENLHWRRNELHLTQHKTGSPLMLPLTDVAGNVLVHYLRQGRPQTPYRELFLRLRAPLGPLQPTAVEDAFEHWWQRSNLPGPMPSPHCLRHAYAAQLLRQGVSLKAIGDLLGHRSVESTTGYLRLAREELREVALEVPHTTPTATESTP